MLVVEKEIFLSFSKPQRGDTRWGEHVAPNGAMIGSLATLSTNITLLRS